MYRTSMAQALVILNLSCSLGASWEHICGKSAEGNKHRAGVWQVLKRKLRCDISTDPGRPIPLNNATDILHTEASLQLGTGLGDPVCCSFHS